MTQLPEPRFPCFPAPLVIQHKSGVFLVVGPSKIIFLTEDIILLYIGYHSIPKHNTTHKNQSLLGRCTPSNLSSRLASQHVNPRNQNRHKTSASNATAKVHRSLDRRVWLMAMQLDVYYYCYYYYDYYYCSYCYYYSIWALDKVRHAGQPLDLAGFSPVRVLRF